MKEHHLQTDVSCCLLQTKKRRNPIILFTRSMILKQINRHVSKQRGRKTHFNLLYGSRQRAETSKRLTSSQLPMGHSSVHEPSDKTVNLSRQLLTAVALTQCFHSLPVAPTHSSRDTHNPGRPAGVISTSLPSAHDEHEPGPVHASQVGSQP